MFEIKHVRWSLTVAIGLLSACDTEVTREEAEHAKVAAQLAGDAGELPASDGGSPSARFPCDVQAILEERCIICHGDPPLAAPFPLTTPASFQGPSYSDPERSMLEVVRERVFAENPGELMPPPALGRLGEDELRTLKTWLDDGAPAGTGPVCPPRVVPEDAPPEEEPIPEETVETFLRAVIARLLPDASAR